MSYPLVSNYASCDEYATARGQFIMDTYWNASQPVAALSGATSIVGFFLGQTFRNLSSLRVLPYTFVYAALILSPTTYIWASIQSKVTTDVSNYRCLEAVKELGSFQAFVNNEKKYLGTIQG